MCVCVVLDVIYVSVIIIITTFVYSTNNWTMYELIYTYIAHQLLISKVLFSSVFFLGSQGGSRSKVRW